MPNWCSASYAIEGDAEEVKSLYKLMKRLQEQKNRLFLTVSVKHGWDAL